MSSAISKHGYIISEPIYQLVNQEIIPGLEIDENDFWVSVSGILDEFIPRNEELLAVRERLQSQLDSWHLNPDNQPFCQQRYQQFLSEIGYLVPEPEDFTISTQNVDSEVAQVAGPQLVVPLMNARFALNAANARWGSLYDALYGSDVIAADDGSEKTAKYNPLRGQKVQAYARDFLDMSLPLTAGSHADSTAYHIVDQQLKVALKSGEQVGLLEASSFVGFKGSIETPSAILCCHHGLHIEIQIDAKDAVAQTDAASVKDIVLESAISTIQDCEDSIAAVDAADKTAVYRNWLGLMKGDLTETIAKNGTTFSRSLNPDRNYLSPDNKPFSLSGRSLQFIRQVGLLMTTDAILTASGEEVPEGIVDAIITSLISLHDLKASAPLKNSKTGSIYMVKPKMHGPEEVQFSCDLFAAIESCLKLQPYTLKMGIMDEERRTSVNLKECIRVAQHRVVFINTGFLDRTGDEIHTSMLAGAVVRKDLMKNEKWIAAYENRNVSIGLKAGFQGKAQIGKGMWATPEEMKAMMATKIEHPQSGANCAWVPSPTAATLHVMHYHQVDVARVQQQMMQGFSSQLAAANDLNDLLTIPLLQDAASLSDKEIQNELDNNVQGLLGYVVRWIDQGIGCSKVPDINNCGRMEDRATLRISSQHICNWLHHKILTTEQIMASLKRMAAVVDEQNKNDDNYRNMTDNLASNIAFQAATDLIFKGEQQPSGYTEPLLHQRRKQIKSAAVE